MRIKMRQTLAILLCAVLLLALAPAGFAVDLTRLNTVTVNLVPNDKSAYQEDLANASIQADFYLLSAAVAPDNQSDFYIYDIPDVEQGDTPSHYQAQLEALQEKLDELQQDEDFDSNDQTAVFNAFKPLAQQFAGVVLDSAYNPTPTKTELPISGNTYITASNLQAGLYLLIIRGRDLTTKLEGKDTDYVVKTTDGDDTVYSTRVVTDDYEYLFEPQLLTVPTKVKNHTEQQYNTAYGDWEYELEIYAKPERDAGLGDLKIIKNLNNAGPDPVTFVFEISWTKKDGTEVTKNVSLTFEGESYKEITLENAIPIGTLVTVNELPTGMGYELVSKSPSEAVTIQPKPRASQADTADSSAETPAVATVTFTNNHVGPGGGNGVLNHFTYIGNNDFAWSQYSDSSEAYPVTAGNG